MIIDAILKINPNAEASVNGSNINTCETPTSLPDQGFEGSITRRTKVDSATERQRLEDIADAKLSAFSFALASKPSGKVAIAKALSMFASSIIDVSSFIFILPAFLIACGNKLSKGKIPDSNLL